MVKKFSIQAQINTKLIPKHWLSLDSHRKSLTILHNLFIRYTRRSFYSHSLSIGLHHQCEHLQAIFIVQMVSCIKPNRTFANRKRWVEEIYIPPVVRGLIRVFRCFFRFAQYKNNLFGMNKWVFSYVHCTFFIHMAWKSIHYPYFAFQYSTHLPFITLNFVGRSRIDCSFSFLRACFFTFGLPNQLLCVLYRLFDYWNALFVNINTLFSILNYLMYLL